jgi:hypothetical protein
MVYKLNVQIIKRCTQQATQGEALSFIEESEPGDLAFLITKKATSFMWHHQKTIILSMPVEKYELTD